MSEENNIRISSFPDFDSVRYLNSEKAIVEYLKAMAEENDPTLMADAAKTVERARQIHGLDGAVK